MTEQEIRKQIEDNKIDWSLISQYQKLSEDFIREFQDYVNWFYISAYQKLSENFIREFQDKVNWNLISANQKLSEEFIKEFHDKVEWYNISQYQNLSKNFIREFKDYVDWNSISQCQNLSESFIKEFKDNIYWYCISKYQKLSESFIKEFKDKVNWYCISKHQKLSESFIEEFKDELDLDLIEDNWLYKDVEFKLNEFAKHNTFKIEDGYVYGYKAVRSNRFSVFNFLYQYLDGKTYESFSDATKNENSFGLSIGTLGYAKDYYKKGIILYVRSKIEDVSRLVHCGEKIRTSRLEILHEIKE